MQRNVMFASALIQCQYWLEHEYFSKPGFDSIKKNPVRVLQLCAGVKKLKDLLGTTVTTGAVLFERRHRIEACHFRFAHCSRSTGRPWKSLETTHWLWIWQLWWKVSWLQDFWLFPFLGLQQTADGWTNSWVPRLDWNLEHRSWTKIMGARDPCCSVPVGWQQACMHESAAERPQFMEGDAGKAPANTLLKECSIFEVMWQNVFFVTVFAGRVCKEADIGSSRQPVWGTESQDWTDGWT